MTFLLRRWSLLVNHQIDKVVFAEILLSHCIIPPPVSSGAKARQSSSVFDAVHLNSGRFKWLIFVNKRTLSGCQITAVTSMHRIIQRRKCVFGTFFKNKKLNGSFSVLFVPAPHNCMYVYIKSIQVMVNSTNKMWVTWDPESANILVTERYKASQKSIQFLI